MTDSAYGITGAALEASQHVQEQQDANQAAALAVAQPVPEGTRLEAAIPSQQMDQLGLVSNLFSPQTALYGGSTGSAQANLEDIWGTASAQRGEMLNAADRVNAALAGSSAQIDKTTGAANQILGSGAIGARNIGDLYSSRINAVGGPAQQGTTAEQQAIAGLQNYANQGPGPSAAQAQLEQARNTNMAQAIALGSSGRGAGVNASAQSAAQAQALAANSQASQQAATLRAQEEAAWRSRQMQAMQAAGTLGGNVQAQALQQQQQAVAQQAAASNAMLGYQQMAQQYATGQSNNLINAQQFNQQNLSTYANTQMTQAAQQNAAQQAAIQAQQNQLSAEAQLRVQGIGSANATRAGVNATNAQVAQQDRAANEALVGTGLTVGGAVVGGLLGGPGGAAAGGAAGNAAGQGIARA
jgi:hypothetical protein